MRKRSKAFVGKVAKAIKFFVLLILTLAILLFVYRNAIVASLFERLSKTYLGAEVRVAGLSLSMNSPHISWESLVVSEPDSWQTLVETGAGELTLEIEPLKRGQVVVPLMTVDKVRLGFASDGESADRGLDGPLSRVLVGTYGGTNRVPLLAEDEKEHRLRVRQMMEEKGLGTTLSSETLQKKMATRARYWAQRLSHKGYGNTLDYITDSLKAFTKERLDDDRFSRGEALKALEALEVLLEEVSMSARREHRAVEMEVKKLQSLSLLYPSWVEEDIDGITKEMEEERELEPEVNELLLSQHMVSGMLAYLRGVEGAQQLAETLFRISKSFDSRLDVKVIKIRSRYGMVHYDGSIIPLIKRVLGEKGIRYRALGVIPETSGRVELMGEIRCRESGCLHTSSIEGEKISLKGIALAPGLTLEGGEAHWVSSVKIEQVGRSMSSEAKVVLGKMRDSGFGAAWLGRGLVEASKKNGHLELKASASTQPGKGWMFWSNAEKEVYDAFAFGVEREEDKGREMVEDEVRQKLRRVDFTLKESFLQTRISMKKPWEKLEGRIRRLNAVLDSTKKRVMAVGEEARKRDVETRGIEALIKITP